MNNINFVTWNKNEIAFQPNDIKGLERIKLRMTGFDYEQNSKQNLVKVSGVFMYQEVCLETLMKLEDQNMGLNITFEQINNYNKNEISTQFDKCIIEYCGYICGVFIKQKSWNWNNPEKQVKLSDNDENFKPLNSYNGLIWTPDIICENIKYPSYFANQIQQGETKFGYRTSPEVVLRYGDAIFTVISIHGPNVGEPGKQKAVNKNKLFMEMITREYSHYDNIILGGDFNMLPEKLNEYQRENILNDFFCIDDKKKITHDNIIEHKTKGKERFLGKIDWIFFRFNTMRKTIANITPYTGDIRLLQNQEIRQANQSDHVRVQITLSIKNLYPTQKYRYYWIDENNIKQDLRTNSYEDNIIIYCSHISSLLGPVKPLNINGMVIKFNGKTATIEINRKIYSLYGEYIISPQSKNISMNKKICGL
jgi:hypothetical protein